MDVQKLLQILSVKRPHADPHEQAFVSKFLLRDLAALKPVKVGPMENVIVKVPGTGNGPTNEKILFSCHTDTVHDNGGLQEVMYDAELDHAYQKDNKSCLGADDGTGVWIMLEMIEAGIPGTYAFHRGEEQGCIGSKWMSENQKEFLKAFDIAIAFDRKDDADVITYQRGRRTCSDEFATALADQLNAQNANFKYKPSNEGVYTDTANYTASIRECTNISVGYEGAHSGGEMQDVGFAKALLEALLKVNWEALPAVREAKEEVFTYPRSSLYDEWSDDGYTSPGYRRSQNGSFGYSASPFSSTDRWVSPEYAVRQMRENLERERSRMPAQIGKVVSAPPTSMYDVLMAPTVAKDTALYLDALMRAAPDHALMVMHMGLQYYQAYRLLMKELDSEHDRGRFGEPPLLFTELTKKYDRFHGFLMPRVPSYQPTTTDREKIAAERKARKEAKKATKAAKRGGKGADAGSVQRFPSPPTCGAVQQGTSSAQQPMNTPSEGARRLALRDAAGYCPGAVPLDLRPLIPASSSDLQLSKPVMPDGAANEGYAG